MNLAKSLRDSLTQNLNSVLNKFSPTVQLKAFAIMQIPLLFLVNPRVEKISHEECEVRIPLNYMTRNHLGSMYFGTLAIGADATVAIFALHLAKTYKDISVGVVFKDFKADFIKRAESDVIFRCEKGDQIRSMIEKAHQTDSRVTEPIDIEGYSADNRELVGKFTLGLSIRTKKV